LGHWKRKAKWSLFSSFVRICMIWTFLLGQRRKEISFVKLCLHSSPPMSQFFNRIIQKIIQPFLKPKSCKKLLQFPKFPSSLCEKTFFVCFFPCYSIISSSAAYSFCTKDPCSILDKIAETFETTSVSPCISKNKALLYILQQIDNYWKSLKSSEARFLWKLPEIILELKLCKLQICPLKCPRLKKSIQIFAHSQSFFSLVCKVHNCHVGDHQILSFFLMSARVFSIYWALLQCIQFSSLKPSLKKYNL